MKENENPNAKFNPPQAEDVIARIKNKFKF